MKIRASNSRSHRRTFIVQCASLGVGLGAAGCSAEAPGLPPDPARSLRVSATERLMREHALLERLLLIYEESTRRLEGGTDFNPLALVEAA